MMKAHPPYGTSTRKLVQTNNGTVLQRQAILMDPRAWDVVSRMSSEQGVGGSQVIEALILAADAKRIK